jgi:hypothetical protein
MAEPKKLKQKNFLKWSLIALLVSPILSFGANFIPLLYFTIAGLPEGGITTEDKPIFDFAMNFSNIFGVIFLLSLLSSVYFYVIKKIRKPIS